MIWVVLGLVIAIGAWGLTTYNRLVGLREMARNAIGQIAAQVESRWDALGNLIQATKQYAAHEAETLEKVTANRSHVGAGARVKDVEAAESEFQGVLGRLIAVAEAYPELKASALYQQTMDSVNAYENNVRHSRMIYNDTVTKLNRAVQSVPTNVIAGIGGFTEMPYFEAAAGKTDMPSW